MTVPAPSRPTPSVSVILPTHNRPAELGHAVRSVLAQTRPDLELLVLDDGSEPAVTAGRPAWLADPRVTVHRFSPNVGVAAARNAGIAAARGAWVAFLDDDDLWAPFKLEAQLAAAQAGGPAVGLVLGSSLFVTPEGEQITARPAPPADDLFRRLWASNVIGGPSTVMARTDLVREAGGFADDLAVMADWDLWLRLAARGDAAVAPVPATAIVEHGANMQRTHVDRTLAELALMRGRHRAHEPAFGRPLGHGTFDVWLTLWQWRASRSVGSLLRFLVSATVHGESPRIAGEVVRRRLRRYTTGGGAPAWAVPAAA